MYKVVGEDNGEVVIGMHRSEAAVHLHEAGNLFFVDVFGGGLVVMLGVRLLRLKKTQ
jgi:hypothetical protein